MSRDDSYRHLAAIYDATVAEASLQYAEAALQQLREHGDHAPGSWLIDLGCGTARATRLFSAAGYKVVALDRSAAMLAEARANLADDERVQLLRGDFRQPGLRLQADALICLHDSLNHLHTDQLSGFARSCHALLRPGGLAAVDLNLCAGGRAMHGHCTVIDSGERFVSFEVSVTGRRMRTRATVFGHSGSAWQRHDELLEQTLFEADEVHQALTQAGFEPVCSQTLQHYAGQPLKQLLVARRSA